MSVFILLIWNKVVVSTKFCIFLIRNSLVVPSLVIYYTILEQFGCAWSSYIFSYSGTIWLFLIYLYILLLWNSLIVPGLFIYFPILEQFGCAWSSYIYYPNLEQFGCAQSIYIFSYSGTVWLFLIYLYILLFWNSLAVPGLFIYSHILEQFGCAWSIYIFSYSETVWLCLFQLYILLF